MQKPKAEVILKGEAAYPRILFDRREIILPIVPCGVESRCVFRLINDGYQSCNLQGSVCDDFGVIPLKINFIDGINLGINKTKMKIEAVFTSPKPLSITTRIDFEDDSNRVYSIFCSATADNCILTNYPYFARNQECYNFTADPQKPISLGDYTEDDKKSCTSKESHTTKAGKATLGYTSIPMSALESSCKHITSWINDYLPNSNLIHFPAEVVNCNGELIFKLVDALAKREPPGKAVLTPTMKKNERINALVDQYKELINDLKEQGCLLNTIRPEFLLPYQDLIQFFNMNPYEFAHSISKRISENMYRYLSMDSWTTLVYQILKIFYLSKINIKKYTSLQTIPEIYQKLPEGYMEHSAIYSKEEVVLLRWVEVSQILVRKSNSRITYFDKDFSDGLLYAALLQQYSANSIKPTYHMKEKCSSDTDIEKNAKILRESFIELGIHNIPSLQD